MNLPFDINFDTSSIILILLGFLAISFPMLSTMTIGIVTGFLFLMIALLLFVTGAGEFIFSRTLGILTILLAIICLILSWLLMFNPDVVAMLASFIIYLLGAVIIIVGVFELISGRVFKPMNAMGIVSLIFGIIYILVGIFVNDPVNLGFVVGIWLIITGIISALSGDRKDYIDV